MTTIKLKRSTTPGNAPASLEAGELAVNEADHRLFFRGAGGNVRNVDLDHDSRTGNPHGVTAAQVGAAPAGHAHSDYLPLAGGTMTGTLTLNGDPAGALEAAPKQYVDANAGLSDPVQNLSRLGINTTAMPPTGWPYPHRQPCSPMKAQAIRSRSTRPARAIPPPSCSRQTGRAGPRWGWPVTMTSTSRSAPTAAHGRKPC